MIVLSFVEIRYKSSGPKHCARLGCALRTFESVFNRRLRRKFRTAERNGSLGAGKMFRISSNHKELQAKLTIPFASFVYFCREDNRDLNAYVNNLLCVSDHLASQSCECLFRKPKENYFVGDQSNVNDRNLSTVDHYQTLFSSISEWLILPLDKVSLQEIEKAYSLFYQRMGHQFSGIFRRFAGDWTCYLEDLGQALCMSLGAKRFERVSKSPEQCDIIVNAQLLLFSLKFLWGFETLGVSGQYQVINARPRKLWKRISILENQELYLTPTSIFSGRNLSFSSERLRAGLLRNFRNRERTQK
jgi:UDP-MurNAc hydroxylase